MQIYYIYLSRNKTLTKVAPRYDITWIAGYYTDGFFFASNVFNTFENQFGPPS